MPLRARNSSLLRTAPLLSVLLALALLAAGTLGLIAQQPSRASADPAENGAPVAATHGAGQTIRGQWVGTWQTADGLGFCIEFDKAHPDSTGVKAVGGNVPGMTPDQSARVRYVTNKYGPTRSKTDGAAAAIYVWQVQDTARFDHFYARLVNQGLVSDAIRKRLAEITKEARRHGPYKLTMTMTAGYPGQSVRGRVTVRAQNGKVAPGLKVALTTNANGVVTRKSPATDGHGRVAFTARVTGTGALRVAATLVTPGREIWVTQPTAGRQRLVLAGKQTATAKASATSERRIGAPTVSSVCDRDCNGAAPVVVRMRNPCGSMTLREFVYANRGRTPVAVVDVAPCTTARRSVTLPDNTLVTTAYCYLDAAKRCVDSPKANAGRLRVECPPLVEYRFSGVCPCADAKTLTYQVRAPASSPRRFTVTMVTRPAAGSPRTATTVLKNGTWASLPAVTLHKGDEVTLRVTVIGRTTVLDAMAQRA